MTKVELAWVHRVEAREVVVEMAAKAFAKARVAMVVGMVVKIAVQARAAEMVALAIVRARVVLAEVMVAVMAVFSRGVVAIAAVAAKAASVRGAVARLDLFGFELVAAAARLHKLMKVVVLCALAMVAKLDIGGFEQEAVGLKSVGCGQAVVAKAIHCELVMAMRWNLDGFEQAVVARLCRLMAVGLEAGSLEWAVV